MVQTIKTAKNEKKMVDINLESDKTSSVGENKKGNTSQKGRWF